MQGVIHAHTETPQANKITKKIRKKQRWPSEKKIQEHPQCSNAYMRTCALAQRNHSLNDIREKRGEILAGIMCVPPPYNY